MSSGEARKCRYYVLGKVLGEETEMAKVVKD